MAAQHSRDPGIFTSKHPLVLGRKSSETVGILRALSHLAEHREPKDLSLVRSRGILGPSRAPTLTQASRVGVGDWQLPRRNK